MALRSPAVRTANSMTLPTGSQLVEQWSSGLGEEKQRRETAAATGVSSRQERMEAKYKNQERTEYEVETIAVSRRLIASDVSLAACYMRTSFGTLPSGSTVQQHASKARHSEGYVTRLVGSLSYGHIGFCSVVHS
jgi:hypothetical protein